MKSTVATAINGTAEAKLRMSIMSKTSFSKVSPRSLIIDSGAISAESKTFLLRSSVANLLIYNITVGIPIKQSAYREVSFASSTDLIAGDISELTQILERLS